MIQLRVRTEYSFGRTYAPIDRLVERLKEQGCTAAGIVDRASTWGHVEWFKACKAAGIKPLLGVELVVTDEDDTDSTPAMWFLARSNAGLRELYRFASAAHRDPVSTKFGSTPRLRRARVEAMSDDIWKFAGDITDGPWLKAIGAVIDLNPSSRILNLAKDRIAVAHQPMLVVHTSDNFYARLEDKELFEAAVDGGVRPTPQHLLDLPKQANAVVIADACNLELPKAPMVRAPGSLRELCEAGIKARGLEETFAQDARYRERLERELELIQSKDFESYFIIVADMVHFAKQHMLVGPSRGSAAGSLVCYLTRITEIDPIPPRLFFERFIDVSRADLPDIDLDFPDKKRQLVFDYMAEKYGAEMVAHIGTVSTYQPKSALIKVCKKLNIPPSATGAVKVAMIVRSSADSRADNCLLDTLTTTDPGRLLVKAYPKVMMAASLEGHASHTGVHAAGLLVSNEPIEDYCTVTAEGIAQLEKGAAEALGLLKIDVLGLTTLGILEDSGVPIDWYNLKFDDPATMDVFNRNRFSSIFQFEGNSMRNVGSQITFQSLNEIDAVTALARPGPFGGGVTAQYLERKRGVPYKALHPLVEEHMADTFGLPIYQEQTMAIVREIGKFGWEDTTAIRKAMSKRLGKEFFDKLWDKFKVGASENGMSEQEARSTWDMINTMGAWQMNKAHTYSYAVISYWTAYLKAHHPLEFAASVLRNTKNEEVALTLLREMVREGTIEYAPFDPSKADVSWSVIDGKLYAGFDSLHGFGEVKAKKFVEARKSGCLTHEMIQAAKAAPSPFHDIWPITSKYASYYSNPEQHSIVGRVLKIEELDGTQDGSCVIIGRLVRKNLRDYNEEVNVQKRGGKRGTGPTAFLDITIADDTSNVICRINRYDYQRMGLELFEKTPLDAVLLVRANFSDGIRFGFIKRWKRIDQ